MAANAQSTPEGLSIGEERKGNDHRQMCKYGINCYQKNPMHHQKFRHPSAESSAKTIEGSKLQIIDSQKENTNADSNKMLSSNTEDKAETTMLSPPPKKPKLSEQMNSETQLLKNSENSSLLEDKKLPCMSDWPTDSKKRIELAFSDKLKMPEDFYEFYEFCLTLNRGNPLDALVATCGLKLVGPFEFLLTPMERKAQSNNSEKSENTKCALKTCSQNDLLCHWRYKYDVPELQTVLASADDKNTVHIGYFRDDPKDMPVFVTASGGNKKEETFTLGLSSHAKLTLIGENLFGAVFNYIQKLIQTAEPFKQTALHKIKEALHVHATMKTQGNDFPLEMKTARMKARDKNKLSTTFHGAGLVVPYNKKTEIGYREIPETTQSLKKIFNDIIETQKGDNQAAKDKAFDTLQELVTNVQFANDEGDPGMGLELGLNAFLYCAQPLDSTVKHLLSVAYELLGRETNNNILIAHLLKRNSMEDMYKAK